MKRKRFNFTLIEVIVSLGIFAIMAMILMQFFTTAQNTWTNSEKRASAYADSRVLFDLMDSSLKSARIDGFSYPNTTTDRGIQFTGILPYREVSTGTIRDIGTIKFSFNSVNGKLNIRFNEGTENLILDNVTEFTILPQNESFGTMTSPADKPSFITVTLGMFGSKAEYDVWNSMSGNSKNDYFTKYGYKFTRLISL